MNPIFKKISKLNLEELQKAYVELAETKEAEIVALNAKVEEQSTIIKEGYPDLLVIKKEHDDLVSAKDAEIKSLTYKVTEQELIIGSANKTAINFADNAIVEAIEFPVIDTVKGKAKFLVAKFRLPGYSEPILASDAALDVTIVETILAIDGQNILSLLN
jgi:hypothetical protein